MAAEVQPIGNYVLCCPMKSHHSLWLQSLLICCMLQTSTATTAVAQSMDTAAKAMAAVGKANNPAEIQRIMQQFQRENAKMDMAGEMMDDALDSAFDTDEMEDETDDVMNQVQAPFKSAVDDIKRLASHWIRR